MLRLALCALLTLTAQVAYCQWTYFGLQGKPATDLAANQKDGSVLAVSNDKLYLTRNNGVDWSLLENGIEGLQVLSIAVDLDNTIYAGTSNGLRASTDGGTSFHSVNDQLPNDFGLYPAVGAVCVLNDHLFIGTSAGVYKTSKSTMKWQFFNNNLPFMDVNAILVFVNDQIYLGMNTGMYRSSVQEANWEKVYDKEINDIIVVGGELYAAGYAEPCYPGIRSSDFGDTWTPLGVGSGACQGMTILNHGEDKIWIGTSAGGSIVFTLDKGVTWQETRIESAYVINKIVRRGTSLLAATQYYTAQISDGAVFVRSNIFENISETLRYPEFVTAPGTYNESIQIEIEAREASAAIYYTTDGTIPEANSTTYNGPISINKSTLINAISIDNTGARSKVNTGYYRLGAPLGVEGTNTITSIFPNPCMDYIDLALSEVKDANITIVDALGRVALQTTVEGPVARIDTRAFNPGLYHVVAKHSNQRSYQRFVKK